MTAMVDNTAMVYVRATVNMAGLKVGQKAYVDPADPFIDECLKHLWLVREPTSG